MISYLELARGYGNQTWYAANFFVFVFFAIGHFGRVADSSGSQGPEDLFETISQALLNAVDRDALSGWGAHVYIVEKDKVTKRLLKGRQD